MAFQMIHMETAYRVMERLGISACRESFMLGSVAPDAVHMRSDYTLEKKIHSHLFEGCGPWGETRDNERWLRNMDRFWACTIVHDSSGVLNINLIYKTFNLLFLCFC